MAIALGTSAAHPLYLYIVFLACVVGALALLISGWISHRRSSWPRYWQSQSTHRTDTKSEPAYPAEPTAPETVAVPDATASIPAKKTTATRTVTKKSTAAKKTTAKKTTPPKDAQ